MPCCDDKHRVMSATPCQLHPAALRHAGSASYHVIARGMNPVPVTHCLNFLSITVSELLMMMMMMMMYDAVRGVPPQFLRMGGRDHAGGCGAGVVAVAGLVQDG